ncbi:zinc finger protein 208-like isoform X2 [Odontomachus brunneus]|uniref:zinc finger protein 208-like isoform X2 n=1 Tax=Odontomachus brunneus TaxID=486640 RepID=UPI0013F2A379|nr:zinc finger protein 208-like isoform X2 [Odontomachus brunneus]
MGSLNLVCPMCCGETFNNPQSLKYHLLSITDNLYCPGCSQRSDSVTALIQHLDKCQQGLQRKIKPEVIMDTARKVCKESENRANILADVKVQQMNRSFLATVNDTGIVIVGDPQTIQVDENGEIKVIEKLDLDETQPDQNSLDFKMSESFCDISGGKQRKPQLSQGLVAIPVSSCVAECKETSLDKSMVAVLSENSKLLDSDVTTFIDVDRINDVGEFDEAGLLRVKQELCGMESDAVYSCTSCDTSFNSVLEHIKQFHDGQEVLLEMAEQFDDLTKTVPVSSISTVPESSGNMVNTRQRQTMNTLRTEECIDSEGRLYTRKVVQIERFWDQMPIQVATSQSAKAPMIEKFFSNVEGIKVREKRLAAAPLRMYKCNQCSQQFSKLGNFRVHACLHGNNRCEYCDQSFATPKALQLHTKVHENKADPSQKTFICTACGTEFCSHKSLRLHSRMHAPVRARHVDAPEGTPSATFTCPECGKIFSESYKNAHMALHTGDSVTCAVCNRKFDSSDSLAMHAAVHTELVPPQSPTSSVLISVSTAGETAAVTTTTLVTTTTTTVTTITTTTTTTRAIATTTATSTLTTTATVTVEASESQKPYQCQHCGRRFTRPHEKVKHERIHTGEKPHACEVCGKTFRVSYCLTLHMRTHTGVRPYTCQHCGKRFKASSVYNHHMLTHGDARAYTCPYCPKTFKTRVQLAGHKNSHTKPFRCTECSRPFASLYAARSHIQTHKKDNNLKYSCYICGASYGRAFALKDHLKQHGQNVLAPPEPAREEEVHEGFLLGEEVSDSDKRVHARLGVPSSTLPVEPTSMDDVDTD